MIAYFFIGVAIGALTGIPIGPVNVAVIESAYRHHLRRALAVGLGGAVADFGYAFLGVVGVGPFLHEHPNIPPVLFALSGLLLVIYGALTVRSKPASLTEVRSTTPDQNVMWTGFIVGFALIVMNPAAIVTWVIIVGSYLADITPMEGAMAALGIGVGSFVWFSLVAWLADHGKRVLGDKMIWVTRVVGILLIGYGIYSLGRAGWYVLRTFDLL